MEELKDILQRIDNEEFTETQDEGFYNITIKNY